MHRYIFNDFDEIRKENDTIILYNEKNNKETILKGENTRKYLLDNIDLLREYTTIEEIINYSKIYSKDDYKNIEILFNNLLKKNILKLDTDSKINLKSKIGIIDFSPYNYNSYFLKLAKEELGVNIEYVTPNDKSYKNLSSVNINTYKISDDIELYIFINNRFKCYEDIFSKLSRNLLNKNKSILYVTVGEERTIIGPLVTSFYDATYKDRETDLKLINNKYKKIQTNKKISFIILNKAYSELLSEIYNYFDPNNSYSNYINEYLIIDNRNSIAIRRNIYSMGESYYDETIRKY